MDAWRLVPWLLLMTLAVPVAQAAGELAGELRTTGETTIIGAGTWTMPSGFMYLRDPEFSKDAHVSCPAGELSLWNYPLQEILVRGGGNPVTYSRDGLEPRLITTVAADSVGIVDLARQHNLVVASFQGIRAAWPDADQRRITGPTAIPMLGPSHPADHITRIEDIRLHPSTPGLWTRFEGHVDMPPLTAGFWRIATFDLGTIADDAPEVSRWPVGHSLNETETVMDPVTGTGRFVYDTWIHRFECSDATLVVPETNSVAFYAESLEGVLDGDVAWRGVESDLWLDGDRLEPQNHILQVVGDLDFEASSGPGHVSWNVEGQAELIRINTEPFHWSTTTVAAAGALTLALLWKPVLGLLRAGATIVLGTRAPGLAKADLLGSTGRLAVLRVVLESQVATVGQLQEETGLARHSVRYHLRVLEAHDVLQRHRPASRGKLSVYSLNSDSLHIPLVSDDGPDSRGSASTSRSTTGSAAQAMAAIHSHPVRRACFAAVEAQPGISLAQVVRRVNAERKETVARSTVADHLKALEGDGAITRRREGRRMTFNVNLDLVETRIRQYDRFLRAAGLRSVLQELWAHAPLTERQALESLAGSGIGSTTRSRRRILYKMRSLGILDMKADGSVAPSQQVRPWLSKVLEREPT